MVPRQSTAAADQPRDGACRAARRLRRSTPAAMDCHPTPPTTSTLNALVACFPDRSRPETPLRASARRHPAAPRRIRRRRPTTPPIRIAVRLRRSRRSSSPAALQHSVTATPHSAGCAPQRTCANPDVDRAGVAARARCSRQLAPAAHRAQQADLRIVAVNASGRVRADELLRRDQAVRGADQFARSRPSPASPLVRSIRTHPPRAR